MENKHDNLNLAMLIENSASQGEEQADLLTEKIEIT